MTARLGRTKSVTPGRLDHQDLGPKVGEKLAAEAGRDTLGELQYPHANERSVLDSHHRCPSSPPAVLLGSYRSGQDRREHDEGSRGVD